MDDKNDDKDKKLFLAKQGDFLKSAFQFENSDKRLREIELGLDFKPTKMSLVGVEEKNNLD